ncbi:MAG: two-component hybrid sensor and regulator [Candidatus Brocadiaceae bacterium]|nr:two-component hybrid sensor and regulator [Candidatus Brocadiaceae bacterium]
MLELSRVGRIAEEKRRLDMNVLLKAFQESIRNRLEKEGFHLVLESAYPTIYANESRVLQAFENLMSNAFKYGRSASGENRVKIGSRENEEEYLFSVTDNGQGIPREYHEKIFGLFYRLDNDMNGSGVGLSVVRKVMQFHGGRVWVESEPGKGATFWLAFPKSHVG